MSKQNFVPFGFKDGRMLDVSEVSRGLSCDCICPKCNAPLIARKGEQRVKHFAHAPGYDVCEGSAETALHLMAKQIIAEDKVLHLPELSITRKDYDYMNIPWEESGQVTASRQANFTSVALEPTMGDFRPDCIAIVGNKELWIEIRVTSPIKSNKKQFVRNRNIPCIEVNLSKLPLHIDKETLRNQLIHDLKNKTWINHSRAKSVIKLVERKLKEKIDLANDAITRRRKSFQNYTPEHNKQYRFKNKYKQSDSLYQVKKEEPYKPGTKKTFLCECCRHIFREVIDMNQPGYVICPNCKRSVSTKKSGSWR